VNRRLDPTHGAPGPAIERARGAITDRSGCGHGGGVVVLRRGGLWFALVVACSGEGGEGAGVQSTSSGAAAEAPAEMTTGNSSSETSDTSGVGLDTTTHAAGEPEGSTSTSTGASTSTSDGETSDDSGSSSDTGASLWEPTCPPPGGAAGVAACFNWWGDACDPLVQDCAAGQKCGFNESDAFEWWSLAAACMPVVGSQTVGEPCSYAGGFYVGADDCDAGSWCNNVDYATMIGECVELCTCGEACATEGSFCQQSGLPPYCGYTCNPLLGDDACKEGWHCQPEIGSVTEWAIGPFTCKPDYSIPGEVGPGGWCPNGFTGLAPAWDCVQLCSTDGAVPCPAGFQCNDLPEVGVAYCPALLGRCDPQ